MASKRLGRSLGINLSGSKRKLCNFNCVYCFYGATLKPAKAEEFPSIEDIVSAVRKALKSDIEADWLTFSGNGESTVHYGGDSVQFDPGSSGVNILDSETLQHKPATTKDLIKIIKIADSLPQYDAQSTAVVCSEIPKEIGDLYRLYLVLRY